MAEVHADEDNENVDALSKNFSELVDKIKTNPAYYRDGIKVINKQISSLINHSSPVALFIAFYSFNKASGFIPRRKMRSTKRIGVNAATVSRRVRFQIQDSKYDHGYNIKNPRKIPNSLMYQVHHNLKS